MSPVAPENLKWLEAIFQREGEEVMRFKLMWGLAAAAGVCAFASIAGAAPPRSVAIQDLTLVEEDKEPSPGAEPDQYHHGGYHHGYHHGGYHHGGYHHGYHHYYNNATPKPEVESLPVPKVDTAD